MSGAATRLVDHALSLEWETLDAPARTAAATFLHDTICVGTAGVRAPYADPIARTVAGWGEAGNERARILGRPDMRLPPANAAFLNAFQIHAQEFDCVHEGAVVHPLATIAAVLLAEVDRRPGYAGRNVLAALVAGVDVSVALGLAATAPLTFFRPATAGIFGCVAALARLRRLSPPVALAAFGHALAFAAGTMQAHVEGMPALPVQVGAAARGAMQAVDLAVAGLPGVAASIDGPFGYLKLFEAASDIAPALDALAGARRISEVSWKPYPSGRASHGAIVATQQLMREHGLNADNLARLVVRAPPLIARLVGRPAVADMVPAYGRLCFAYLGAMTLLRGTVSLGDFTPELLQDAQVRALAARISVEADGNPDPAAFTPALIRAELRDGRTVEATVAHQLGSPAWPLTRAQHLAKAQACLDFAGFGLAQPSLIEAIERLPTLDDARSLIDPVSAPLSSQPSS